MFQRLKELLLRGGLHSQEPKHASPPLSSPFELVTSPSTRALSTWRDLRTKPGIVPILLGTRSDAEGALEIMSFHESPTEAILAQGLAFDIDAWMKQQVEAEPDYYEHDESETGPVEPLDPLTPARGLKPHSEVFFALVPTETPWHVPAHLKPGGWNECPDPAVHVAFFKRWYDQYAAVPTTITNDIIEFHVERPPRTRADATKLAREQFIYCPDLVNQGVGTLGNLAAALVDSKCWYFWWD